MSLDPDSFRAVLGRFATGVTVVTTKDSANDIDHGMTVSAFSSLSLHPPLIIVCIDKNASMHGSLTTETPFVVNILSHEQEALARRFAEVSSKRFDGIGYSRSKNDIAILDDCLAHLECVTRSVIDGGDHSIIIGEVTDAKTCDTKPLLYYRGGYAQLER